MARTYFLLFVLFNSCGDLFVSQQYNAANYSLSDTSGEAKTETLSFVIVDSLELRLLQIGLVDIKTIDSTIKVDLKYSSIDNFFGVDVYGSLENAYLNREVAQKLKQASEILHEIHNNYNLLVYDAARPLYVQQIMWDTVRLPMHEKTKYLSNPKRGSLHNYGAAVDITIVDSLGIALDMGTAFDYFGEKAYPRLEWKMLQEKKLSQAQINNRKLLREVMYKAGFFNIDTEWWHFNSCTRPEAEKKYKLIK